MGQPPTYTRQYNFNDFATTSPSTPLPGDKVDAELNAAKLTLDELNANIALIQRDDGKLGNTSVHKDAFDAGALALMSTGSMTPRGSWSAGVSYAVSDLADFNNATYLATAAHTSASAFTTDLAASRWILLANAAISGTANSVDKFSGTGSQTAFTLTSSYASNTSVLVFVNGALRNPGDDYSISGTTLTFVTAPPVPSVSGNENVIAWGPSVVAQAASDAALASSSNASGFADEAESWASKVNGIVESTDYSSKAWSIGGTGVDAGSGSAKDWATKTGGTVGNTSEYSAKYWATQANVGTVAGAVASVNTVAGISANVTTVAGISGNVSTVSGIASDVSTVAADGSDIGTVAGISANVTTVAGISANVTTVAGVSGNVSTVAGIASDVSTVAADGSDIGTVAGISGNVSTVAGIASDVSTVAADGSDIGAVAGISANVTTVAGIASDVSTVAADGSDIGAVAGSISNVNSVSGSIANVNTVATNISGVNSFAAQYRTGSSDPTSSLDEGDLFYNTTANQLKIYNGTQWENAAPAGSGFLATSGGTMTGNLALGDNNKATFGAGSDLEISHNSNLSLIKDVGTGGLTLSSNGYAVVCYDNANSNNMAEFITGAGTKLYYNGNLKFEVKSTGVDVTGTVQADQFNNDEALPDVRPSLLLDFANSKTLDPRITFTRGSTATYWDGVTTAKAEENLVKYSQEFDNSGWTKTAASVSANSIAAPDGTTTADTFTATGANANISLTKTYGDGGDATFSVYIKRKTGSGNVEISHTIFGTATVVSVTSDWQRFEVTTALSSGSRSFGIELVTSGDEVYLWGAQLEQRSSATAYTPTTSSPIVKYQPALQTAASGAARFDHDPLTGESKGLLIEEARTNIAYPSNQQSGTYLSRATQNTTGAIAPDGTQTASIVRETTETGAHHIHDSIVGETANTVYTASIYLKNYGVSDVALKMRISDSGDVYKQVFFDLDNIAVSFSGDAGYTGTITDVGNGWRRCTITGDVGDGTNDLRVHVFACQGTGTISSYTGNGWDGFGYWGLQVEAGTFPTSYIPTTGSAVTRADEYASITGTNFSDFFSNQVGTFYAQFGVVDAGHAEIGERLVTVYPSDSTEVKYNIEGYRAEVRSEGTWNAVNFSNESRNGGRVALGFDFTGFSAASSGADAASITAQPTHKQAGRMFIGSAQQYGHCCCCIPKISYYPKRLSTATLKAMTTE